MCIRIKRPLKKKTIFINFKINFELKKFIKVDDSSKIKKK